MRVDLRTLQPNPMRDFTIDPLDPEVVERLRQSIAEDGFWGGMVCRKLSDGTVQIGAGHHRVAAALAAGITEADLFVAEDMDNRAMVRVYARENATQRGLSSTALTGTVAAAMRYVAKAILMGSAEEFFSSFHLPTLRERLLREDGMGREVVLAFLHDIPGINDYALQHQLANLKTSGDYARLIAEVQQEIAAERAPAEVQAMAHEAATSAAKHLKTFDFQGVAQHLKNPHQVDVFRTLVTSDAVRPILAVEHQGPLAGQLVAYADANGEHLSGECIRRNFTAVLLGAQVEAREADRAREAHDLPWKFSRTLARFDQRLTHVHKTAQDIDDALHHWPSEDPLPDIPVAVRRLLQETLSLLTTLSADRRLAL